MATYSSQIDKKYDELRNIGQGFATLVGRDPKFNQNRKRSYNGNEDAQPARRENDRRISYDSNDRGFKRSKLIEDEPPLRRKSDNKYENEMPSRRSMLQSSVRMPTIETKSRDDILAEQKKSQTGADGARNRRMFGSLLLGTLQQFKEEEKAPAVKAQHDKLKEIEEKLEKSGREDKEKFLQEKKAYEMKLREKEMEIKRLKQKQAIQTKNENKIAHYKRLQNFIQTETKPPIFFLPAQMNPRATELLEKSARSLDGLIKKRETEMESELRALDDLSDGEIGPAVRSAVKVVRSNEKDSRAHLKPMGNTDGDDAEEGMYEDDEDDEEDNDEILVVP